MDGHFLYFFFFFWGFCQLCANGLDTTEVQKIELIYPTIAPNSKFLNPYLDDQTNLQLAIAAFGDGIKETDKEFQTENLLEISEEFSTISPKELTENFRNAKSLKDWRVVPIVHSLFRNADKGYKLRKL